jgi:hypothetical protein
MGMPAGKVVTMLATGPLGPFADAYKLRLNRQGCAIAVGTALAGGPPRRSQRALLTHWAPALGLGVEPLAWEGMHHAGGW